MSETTTEVCARCGVAPRNSSLKSYCIGCKRDLARESRDRRGVWKKPQANCSRCGGTRDGRHPSYCKPCFTAWKLERLQGPCTKCGKTRIEGDRTNSAYCYDCWRDWWLRRKYGLSGKKYQQLLDSQDHRCAICGTENNGRTWHVDHCHRSGNVRGILCDNCNRGLGHLRDDAAVLRAALAYLEKAA